MVSRIRVGGKGAVGGRRTKNGFAVTTVKMLVQLPLQTLGHVGAFLKLCQ